DDACAVLVRHETVRALEYRVRLSAVRRRDACGQLRPLPEILVCGLRHRNIETIVQLRLQAPDDAALLLERLAADDLELPDRDADDHTPRSEEHTSELQSREKPAG